MRRNLPFAVMLVLLLPAPAVAQELPTATKHDASWATAVDVDFKPGQEGAALDIVYDHLQPAAEAIGWNVLVIEYETGEWDARYVLPLTDGPANLEWAVSQTGEGWWAELARREGGAEAAFAMWQEYLDKVARVQSNIIRQRR